MHTNECKLNEYQCSERKSGSLRKYWLVVLFFVILLLPIILFLLWFSVHFEYDEGYDSPEKLMHVYQQYESDFKKAELVFTQLPDHSIEGEENYYRKTIIRSTDRFETSKAANYESNLIQRTYKTLQISSPIPYSESEYEQIFSVASPLIEKLSLDRIIIFSDRKQIYFVVFDDNREWVGHADIIMYDANTEVLEGNALNEYISALASERQPVVLEMIQKGWIVFSQGET